MTTDWPTGRVPEAAIAARFGDGRTELLERALRTGDPLADAAVAEVRAGGPAVRAQLDRGIRDGLAALTDPPPAIAALLADAESLPAGTDPALLDDGARPFFTSPPPVHTLSLSAGALLRTYESPSIAVLLGTTGRLVDGAERRLTETGRWLLTATQPGGLHPGGPGYVATLQVRVLHAHMRVLARSRGYDEAAHGAPINQVDLARTWLDFTLVSMRAEQTVGFGLTDAEIAETYRYWQVVAHQLGIDPELVGGITDHAGAARLDAMVEAVTGPLVPESALLTGALLDAMSGLLVASLHLPRPVIRRLMEALGRRFHGPVVAEALGLRRSRPLDALLGVGATAVRMQRARMRRKPGGLEAARARNVAAARALLVDDDAPALFQTHTGSGAPTGPDAPRPAGPAPGGAGIRASAAVPAGPRPARPPRP